MENETKRPDDKAWADELFFLENAPDGMMRTAAIRAVAAEAERARKSEAAALALNAELVEALTMAQIAMSSHASAEVAARVEHALARARRSASEGGADT
jgi:hypothetical protein